MVNGGTVSSFAARGLIVLLIVIPVWGLVTPNAGNLIWGAWALVSLWTALDAIRITVRAFPSRHTPTLVAALTLLGLMNLALALYVVINPTSLF